MIRSRLMRPVQVKNKPDLNTLSAVGPVERRHSPCDLKPFDNSPKCQDESLGIASADSPFSKESTNALNPRFFRDFTRIDHRNHPYADADSSFRISGFTSKFHFQMAKMGG